LTTISFEAFLTGATLAGFCYYYSSDEDSTFLAAFLDWVLATGFFGASSSDSYEEDSTTFFLVAAGF
jgi:hypothetical protein